MPSPGNSGPITLRLAVERYLEVSLFLLVLTSFGALAATGALDLPSIALVGIALVARGYLLAKRQRVQFPERWTTLATLLYVGFYLADYFLLSGNFLSATVHLVLFVMVVRMFTAQRDRDHFFLAIIAFLMILASAVLTVDSTFMVAFALFMLTAVATFILMEMKRSAGSAKVHAKEPHEPQAHRRMGISLASLSPALVALILAGAAGIFFLLPRISTGYLSAYNPGSDLSTGFSEKVQLGRIGRIQQSNALVMHIQIDGDKVGKYDLKWRGVALSLFDGRTWSNPYEQVVVPRSQDGRFALYQANERSRSFLSTAPPSLRDSVHYTVLMEPISSNVFFLAPRPVILQGAYGLLTMDGSGAIYDLDAERPISRYEAISDLDRPTDAQLQSAGSDYPAQILSLDTELPPLDRRVAELAEQITAGVDGNFNRAVAVERYLTTNYSYTLELPSVPPSDPIATFLFDRKRGHCEYFASSMAVLLRSLRIPARIVNGFRTGEFNDLTSQYVVRAANAHSWVEVYFPGYGWVSFDPTPGGIAETHQGWSRIALYLDAMASFWREWIVNYDLGHQQRLGREVAQVSRHWVDDLRNWSNRHYMSLLQRTRRLHGSITSSPGRWSAGATLLTCLLVLLLNVRRLWRSLQARRLTAHPERSPAMAASIWYERMLSLLRKNGWSKSEAQTPSEFLNRLPDSTVRRKAEQFTRHYEGARFGGSAEDARRLPELYEEVSTAARR
jgi:transglutaminase-like putative cysteine protease